MHLLLCIVDVLWFMFQWLIFWQHRYRKLSQWWIQPVLSTRAEHIGILQYSEMLCWTAIKYKAAKFTKLSHLPLGVVSCPSSYIGFMHTSLCSINSWIEDMSRNVTCWQVWYWPSGVRRRGHNQGTWTSICFDTADCASWSPPRSSSWVESANIQHQDFHLKWS